MLGFAGGRADVWEPQLDVNWGSERVWLGGDERYSGERELANPLALSAPEMTALVGGLRVLGANQGGSKHGVFTQKPGSLSNDFFVHLLDMGTVWQKSAQGEHLYEGRDRATGAPKWTATSVDLVFGSHSQLCAIAEVYASEDSRQKFVEDFVAAWSKVMTLDRFDLARVL